MKRAVLLICVLLIGGGAWLLRDDTLQSRIHVDEKASGVVHERDEGSGATGTGKSAKNAPLGAERMPEAVARKTSASVGGTSQTTLTMPAANASLKDVMTTLRATADQGDARAACRVGLEMRRCAQILKLSNDDSQASPTLTEMQKFGEQFCDGVSQDDLRSNTWRYIWRAAAAGNVTAMSEFVRDPGIYGDPAASADGWAIYRDHVQEINARAVAAGDPMSAYFGAFAYAFGFSAGGQGVVATDPYTALVYANAARSHLDPQRSLMLSRIASRMESQLSPDQVLEARRDAEALSSKMSTSSAQLPPVNQYNADATFDAGMNCVQ